MSESSHKVVLDTSSLISLTQGGLLDLILDEFQIVVSNLVIKALEETAKFKDEAGKSAKEVLESQDRIAIKEVVKEKVQALTTSKLHDGEASGILLAKEKEIKALISDDFDAMAQLKIHSEREGFDLGLGATLIEALVLRGKLSQDQALESIDEIASKRDWMGRPIYKAYKKLFENA